MTLSAALLIVSLTFTPGWLQPEETSVHQRTMALAAQLMSPYCHGLLLSNCQSQGGHDLREEIGRRLAAGESEAQIVDDLVYRFGPDVRAVPVAAGMGLVAWVAPVLIAFASVVVLALVLRRFTAGARDEGRHTAVPAEPADLRARLDQALADLD